MSTEPTQPPTNTRIKPKHSNKPTFLRLGCPPAKFFTQYRGLIYKFALFYTQKYHRETYLEDFISVGNIALIHAWRKFDETLGYKFSTYFSWWLVRYMQKYLNEIFSIVVKKPSNGDRVIVEQRKQDLELNAPLKADSETEYEDLIPHTGESAKQLLIRHELLTFVREQTYLTAKNEKERTIIQERLLNPNPIKLKHLAVKLNMTKQGVSTAEIKLKNRIKARLEKSKQFKQLIS